MAEREVSEAPARASAISRVEWAMDAGELAGASSRARHTLLVLARYAKTDYGPAWPSVGLLSLKTGYHKRSVYRALMELLELGLIERKKRRQKASSIYILSGWRTGWKAAASDTVVTSESDRIYPESDRISTSESGRIDTFWSDSGVNSESDRISTQNQGGVEEPSKEKPSNDERSREQKREGEFSLASMKQKEFIGSLLREKGKSWSELLNAWQGIAGVQGEAPSSFDTLLAQDVQHVVRWLKAGAVETQKPQAPPAEYVTGEQDEAAAQLWREALELVKGQVSRLAFATWLEGTQGWTRDDSSLVVVLENQSTAQYITNRLYQMLQDALIRAAYGEALELQLRVKGGEHE